MRGAFVVFEGGEGAGKSTQTQLLADALRAAGHQVVITREPGGTPAAERIREILLDVDNTNLPDTAEALLFAAARADHAANLIRPALDRGAVVICDRYIDSSVAYQGYGRGLGADRIRDLSLWATHNLIPDLTIYLDVPQAAQDGRMAGDDRLEQQSTDFHAAVLAGYHEIAQQNPNRSLLLDATRQIEQLAAEIHTAVIELLI